MRKAPAWPPSLATARQSSFGTWTRANCWPNTPATESATSPSAWMAVRSQVEATMARCAFGPCRKLSPLTPLPFGPATSPLRGFRSGRNERERGDNTPPTAFCLLSPAFRPLPTCLPRLYAYNFPHAPQNPPRGRQPEHPLVRPARAGARGVRGAHRKGRGRGAVQVGERAPGADHLG